MSLMSAAEFRQSVTIPAVPEQVRAARVFVARALGKSRVDLDLFLLLASELVANSVRHSGPAVPGGVVTVNPVRRPRCAGCAPGPASG